MTFLVLVALASLSARQSGQPNRDPLAGIYRDDAGQLIGIAVFPGGRTVFIDFAAEMTGRLTMTSEGQLVCRLGSGKTISAAAAKDARGAVVGLT